MKKILIVIGALAAVVGVGYLAFVLYVMWLVSHLPH